MCIKCVFSFMCLGYKIHFKYWTILKRGIGCVKTFNDTACIKSILCTLWHFYFDFWHNCIIKYLSAHVRKIFSNCESFYPRFARAKNLSHALNKIVRTCIEIYYLCSSACILKTGRMRKNFFMHCRVYKMIFKHCS